MKNLNIYILLLRISLVALVIALLAGVWLVWLSGEKETADAFANGRRLVIALESGEIKGKIITSETSDEKPSTTETNTPEASTPPEEPAKADATTQDTSPPAQETATPAAEATAPASPPAQTADTAEVVATITSTPEDEAEIPPPPPSTSPPAPLSKEVFEKTEFGTLPKMSSSGEKPWKFYAKPIILKSDKPKIAIIVTGVGSGKRITDMALNLPESVSLSFSPYGKDLATDMNKARIAGHELMLDLPMEPADYPATDPGPLGLLISKEQQENEIRIKKLMAQESGYVGFLTPQNEVFLANTELFKSLLQVLSGRGLMLVVGKPPAKDETKEVIEKGSTASVIADTLIDEELTASSIDARLSLLEQIAKEKGVAVGIAQSYPITIKQIGEWAKKADEHGFVLVPVSVIVSKRF